MNFIKSNPHPTGKKIGDCVVRAISIAERKKWIDVYKDLCDIGGSIYDMPNSKATYEKYLTMNGWVKKKMPKHPSGKRMKLSDFAELMKGKLFIASVVKHLTVVEDNTLLDTWDCGCKCVGNYFIKANA